MKLHILNLKRTTIGFFILVTMLTSISALSEHVYASPIQVQLEGKIRYIQGLEQNVDFGAAVAGVLAVNDPVFMSFEFDPIAYTSTVEFGTTKVFVNAIGDWQINFNNDALIIEHDPSVTTTTSDQIWVNTNGQSFFTLWDYDLSGAGGSIQAPEFASVAPYDSNWIPWQLVLFFASPFSNSEIPLTPDFTEMRFDYVAHKLPNSNVQSGLYVTWDQFEFVGNSPPPPVPEASTVLLLSSGIVPLVWYGRKRKKN